MKERKAKKFCGDVLIAILYLYDITAQSSAFHDVMMISLVSSQLCHASKIRERKKIDSRRCVVVSRKREKTELLTILRGRISSPSSLIPFVFVLYPAKLNDPRASIDIVYIRATHGICTRERLPDRPDGERVSINPPGELYTRVAFY